MFTENFKVTGQVTIQKNGEVVRDIPNTIVTAGKNDIASLITGAGSVMTHMAVGTGTTSVAAGDTTLGTENDRNALSVSGGAPSTNTIVYTGVWAAGDGTAAITEAASINSS